MRRPILAAAVVAALGIVGLLLFGRGDPPVQTDRAGRGSTPTPASTDPGEAAPEDPAPAPEKTWPVRVHTNVPGCRVTLEVSRYGAEPDPEPIVKTADEDGFAGFPLPDRPDRVAVALARAEATGYAPAREDLEKWEARLTLEPAFVVRGRVLERGGGPVAGAMVRGRHQRTNTGADGTFVLHLAESGAVNIAVVHASFRVANRNVEAPSDDVVFLLDRGRAVSGRVTFPDGSPAPHARLRSGGSWTDTDEDGRYVLSGLPEGEVAVQCAAAREARTVASGTEGVDFVAKRHLVVVRITDVDGRPYKNAGLSYKALRGEEFAASGAGDADWMEAHWFDPDVRVFFTPYAPDCATTATRLDLGPTPRRHVMELVLRPEDPPGAISLRVTDEEGRPARRIRLTLTLEGEALAGGWYEKKVELDESGRARLENVPPGALYLEVTTSARHFSPKGYGMTSRTPIVVASGEVARCDVTVPTGGRVRVTVRDKTGKVVAPGRLDLLDEDGKRVLVIFLQILGEERWTAGSHSRAARPALLSRPVPVGRYRVTVQREGKVIAGKDVTIRKGTTVEIDFRLDREEKVDENAEKHIRGDG